jgi:phage tail-like protein
VPQETPYRYVNVAGTWPDGATDGLVADGDGRLRLAPGPGVAVPFVAVELDPAGGVAGLAVGCDGTLWVADPGGGRVLRVDPCDRRVTVFGCLDRGTGDPAAPRSPRGVALGPRDCILIADPGTGRVLLADRATGALRDVWDGFVEPWAVAVDAEDRVLVADAGAPSLRRFDADGEEDRAFAAATGALGLQSPRAVAVLPSGAIVVGDMPWRMVVVTATGAPDDAASTALAAVPESLGFVPDGDTLWAAGDRGVTALTAGVIAGRADLSVAGIALHCDGRVLLVTPSAIIALAPGGASAYGTIVVPAPVGLQPWDRVRVCLGEPLAEGTHLRVWTRADGEAAPGPPGGVGGDEPEAPLPTPAGTWRAAPLDVLDVRPLVVDAARLWIAVELHGDGSATPVLDDVRVDRMAPGWLDDLPRVLIGDEPAALERLLALVASVYEDTAAGIDALPAALDVAATADRPDAPWLARLARWVDVELFPRADPAQRRALVREAMAVHERRGTVKGIGDAVRRETGVEVTITEPTLPAAWTLGGAGLALGTALPAAPPGPPTLDTTAVVDRSWLIDPEERGLPLLGGIAHRFCVLAPEGVLDDPAVRAAIERVVEREKPAHTGFELGSLSQEHRVGDLITERTSP